MIGENLYGDDSIKARITPAIHFSHPARAELREDFIRPKLSALSYRHFFNPDNQ